MNNTQQENYMKQDYLSKYPKWLRFLIFMKSGLFNGPGWKIKIARFLCWFDRHEYDLFLRSVGIQDTKFEEQQQIKQGYEVSFYLQCTHCGFSKRFSGLYRGHDEHRIKINK